MIYVITALVLCSIILWQANESRKNTKLMNSAETALTDAVTGITAATTALATVVPLVAGVVTDLSTTVTALKDQIAASGVDADLLASATKTLDDSATTLTGLSGTLTSLVPAVEVEPVPTV
jgi:hypothetical protein